MTAEQRPIRFTPQLKLITVAIIVCLAVWFLLAVKHMLTPFVAAIITAYVFNPLISWLQRRSGSRRAFWITVLYVLAGVLIYTIVTLLWPRIVQQSGDLAASAPQAVIQIRDFFRDYEQLEVAGLSINLIPLEEQLIGVVGEISRRFSESVPHLVFSALETVLFVIAYLIVTFYLLLQGRQLKEWASRLVPLPHQMELAALGRQVDAVCGAYIRGQIILVLLMAFLLYIPLSILRVPNALLIAIVSGVLEIIPIVGPWSAAAIAMSVALFQTDIPFGMSTLGLVAVIGLIYLVLRMIEENIILPQVMGPLVTLHPAVVIFALLAGGALLGPFGLFISIPVAAVIRIVLGYLYRKLTDQPEPPDPTLTAIGRNDAPSGGVQQVEVSSD